MKYVEPHSPFQKLIDARRCEMRLSIRGLADAATKLSKTKIPQSSLWIWLHNENGYPSTNSFGEDQLQALAKVLHLDPADIRKTIDASRHVYTAAENPVPQSSMDAFAAFIQILENDKRIALRRSYVLNLAKNLHRGAQHAGTPVIER